MSDIVNTATIKVVADASGVEAGLREASNAARQAGQAVSQVGAGAAASGRAIESAQRSIIASIQRTTTAMESGGRSTAAYFELLARQRGLDSNVLSPYIAQLRAVEEAQARAAQTAAEQQVATKRAADSAREQVAAQRELAQAQAGRDSFLNGLREQIALYGRSTEEVLRYRAAQADAAQAAAPLILQLQNMRAAQEQAEAAARAQAAAQREVAQAEASRTSFLDGLREQISLFGRSTEEVLQYRAAQLGAANAAAPLIAQLRALRDAQDQVAAAARAAEQAQRDAAQAQGNRDSFLAGLREQVALFGRSADEVLRYQAAQVGAASAAEPMIQQLRALRDAQEQATAAARAAEEAQRAAQQVQARKDSFVADLREQIALYGLAAEEVQRYRAAQLGLSNVADPLIAQLRALRAAEEQATAAARANEQAQRDALQVQAGKDSFIAGLREQVALYGMSTEEAQRYRAAQLGVAAAADPLIAQLQAMRVAQEQVAAAARAQAQAQREAEQAQNGRDSFIKGLEQQAAAIGKTRLELLELQAAQMGVSTQAKPFIDQLRAAEQSMQNGGMSAAAMAAALRGVPAQLTDIIVSLQGGQAPLTVFLQQGGQLRDMFGSAGAAAKALGNAVLGLITPTTVAIAAFAALAYAYKTGHDESIEYSRTLASIGNIAGTTSGQMGDMARRIGEITGSQHEAAGALVELAATGMIAGANLERFGIEAIEAQHVLHKSVSDTAAEFAQLGKSPLAGLQAMGEKYHFITAETYAAVKAAQEQGRTVEAANIAQQAYADGISKQRQKVLDSLTDWERGWLRIKKAASGAVDAVIDFAMGRQGTDVDKIRALQDERDAIEARIEQLKKRGMARDGDSYDPSRDANVLAAEAELDANKRAINVIRDKQDVSKKAAVEDAAAARREDLKRRWIDEQNVGLTRQELLKRELRAADKEGRDNGLNEKDIQERLAVIRRKYNDVYVQGIETSITALRRRGEIEAALDQRALAQIEMQRSIQGMSEEDAINRTAQIELAAMDRQGRMLQEQLAMVRTKINSQREQADLEGQIAVLGEQRHNRELQQQNDLIKLQYARQKALDDMVKAWDESATSESDAAAVELGAVGKSSQARQVLAAQLKLEADARKFVDAQIEAGRDLNTWELAMLEQKVAARKEALAVAMNERAAAAGAQELLEANRQFGLEYIADERQRAMAQLAIDAQKWQELIRNAGEGTEAQKALQQQYDVWYQNQLLKPQLDAQKKGWESIESTAHDTFVSIFDSGKSAFDRLRDALKNGLMDLLYQMTLKKWIISIQADMTGSMLGSAGSALASNGANGSGSTLSSLLSAGSMASAASKGWAMLSNGFAGLSDAVAGGVQSAMSAFGYTPLASQGLATAGGQALTPAASAAGGYASSAAGIGIGAIGGHYVGGAVSGGYGVGGHENGVNNTGAVIGTGIGYYVGGAFGAAIGGLIGGAAGGLVNRVFGRKAPEVEAQGIRGSISADGSVSGQFYQDIIEKGGWFKSDKRYDNDRALDAQEQSQIGQAFLAITDASSALAQSLGLGRDALAGYTKAFDIAFTDDATKNQQAVEAFFTGVADEVAGKLVPNLASFSQSGESASATLQRLAGEFDATTVAAQNIGKTAQQVFGSIGMDSAAARERLVQIAGGTSALTSLTGSYAQSYLTEAQRLAPVAKALDEALGQLGLSSIPKTREEFKSLVDGLDLTNEAQAKQFISLMQLGDAFAAVHPATEALAKTIEQIAQEQTSLRDQLDELTMSPEDLVKKQRAAIDDSNKSLFDQVQAAKDAKAAIETHNSLLELQAQIYELNGDKAGAAAVLAEQQAIALAALDPALRGATQQLWNLQAAAKAAEAVKADASTLLGGVDSAFGVLQRVVDREKKAVQTTIDAHTEAVSKLQSLSQSLHSTLDSLKSPDQKLLERTAGQAQIRAALAAVRAGGKLPEADALKNALSAVQQDATSQFADYNDYLRDLYQTQSDIGALAGLTDDSLSVEEKALDAAQKQLEALDGALVAAQKQIDVLKGIDANGVSLIQAIQALGSSIMAAQANPVVSAGSAVNSAYQQYLGRGPDQAGLDWWKNQAAAGVSVGAITDAIKNSPEAQVQKLYQDLLGRSADAGGLDFFLKSGASTSDIAAAIKGSDEYQKLHIPGFAGGGLHGGGLRIVGENGPELEATGPSRIWSSSQTAAILSRAGSGSGIDVSQLAGEMQELRRENAMLRQVVQDGLRAIAEHTSNTASHLDDVVNGRKPIPTEVVQQEEYQ